MKVQYAYIFVKETITITEVGDDDTTKQTDEGVKGVLFKFF